MRSCLVKPTRVRDVQSTLHIVYSIICQFGFNYAGETGVPRLKVHRHNFKCGLETNTNYPDVYIMKFNA
jgi:hypothetical protein